MRWEDFEIERASLREKIDAIKLSAQAAKGYSEILTNRWTAILTVEVARRPSI